MSNKDGFKNYSGCFDCATCGRPTRCVAKQGNTDTCPHCHEVALTENMLSDCKVTDPAALDASNRRIALLKTIALKLGGDPARLGFTLSTTEAA